MQQQCWMLKPEAAIEQLNSMGVLLKSRLMLLCWLAAGVESIVNN
jgi:hypothetical protein